MRFPMIHLNGTSGEQLLDYWRDLVDTLQLNAPHPRDYYPLGDTAYDEARREHETRIIAARSIRDQCLAICLNIDEQNDQRRK